MIITVIPAHSFLHELLREDGVHEVGVVCTAHSETNSDKVSFTTLYSENDEDIVSIASYSFTCCLLL